MIFHMPIYGHMNDASSYMPVQFFLKCLLYGIPPPIILPVEHDYRQKSAISSIDLVV